MPTTRYYHVTRRPLRIGTTLTIGAFGESLRQEEFIQSNYATYLKEEIFEDIRRQHYPQAPSRFNCIFLFSDFNVAREFYANTCGYKNYVYLIEIEEGTPFTAEMDLLRCDNMRYETITSNAHKYWQQIQHPSSGTLEAILTGKAVVKELLLEPSKIW